MARERRKAAAQSAPQTIEEATALAARYVDLLDAIELERVEAQSAIDEVLAARDAVIAPREEELKDIFRQLRPWWTANREDLTDGKRKSIELAGAQLGDRTTTPRLAAPKGMTQGDLTDLLVERGLRDLVRTRHAIDKPACLKVIRWLDREEPDPAATAPERFQDAMMRALGEQLVAIGTTVTQREEFFIDRAGDRNQDPEIVPVEGEAE
ncbi:host-nuclease inhibitor Gam family protein [Alteriqipengyuania flavescens]|uniref:host-nuclease inhibitor Gam family protein n=1 Tax=Alteriqipengyuania flavescens TaxID=3053610 RepID=UPI0025B3F455|nr:host-nuclease inhibitor Gam family protein [Alteriqipengyuania flavescens]WJY18696.1 host-nuclease inhibitor Gam family protein [Alteriqipengyuania flavescens]WJY24636.1 host-nuclease inhibitor Gam family protein [Alteriqipengyuania flavescens]